jgi:DNA-binding Lrp family transcriptional regulator
MPEAFVLINCDLGSEESVIEELKHVDNVKEVNGTFGAYNIIAKISSKKTQSIKDIITWQIRKIDNVRSTLTLMGTEGQK